MLQVIRVTPAQPTWLLTPLLLTGCFMGKSVEVLSTEFPIPPTISNRAPAISGNPARMAKIGINYFFTPAASDSDSDPISFSIETQPGWTNFDSAGNLSGVAVLGNESGYHLQCFVSRSVDRWRVAKDVGLQSFRDTGEATEVCVDLGC